MLGLLGLFIVLAVAVTYKTIEVKSEVKELFKLNKALKAEGYFMTDFEFQLVGMGYDLDKGRYKKALTNLSDYHKKLSSKDGLIKVPEFSNNQEEIDFYLHLQNPHTGAFISETAPFCVYYESTKNVLEHLVSLSDSSTLPLKLKYPLSFLDSINTPETIVEHLNDISYVGWIASHFPQTSFHFARNILDATKPDNILESYHLYAFSSEWKHTILKWMYDFQDTTTGMWGPKDKSTNKLRKYDLNNTKSIVKIFRDTKGKDIYEEFPLRYGDKLFKSSLEQLSEAYPDEDDLAKIHEWNLRQAKGLSMLLRYLWNEATTEDKKEAKKLIARNIDICFKNYYVAQEGAFSYYPNSHKASPDGITNLIFNEIGAFSYHKQKKLWGDPEQNSKDMGEVMVSSFNTFDMDTILNMPEINSVRIYKCKPAYANLTDSVWAVFYPKETLVLDAMEIVPNIVSWAENSALSMGNWLSMAELKKTYSKLGIEKPIILKDHLPIIEITEKLKASSELYFVGFDKLQIPRYCICYKYFN